MRRIGQNGMAPQSEGKMTRAARFSWHTSAPYRGCRFVLARRVHLFFCKAQQFIVITGRS